MQQKELANISLNHLREFNKIINQGIKSGNLERDRDAPNAQNVFEFSQINYGKGKLVYLSFSDEDLCQLLREKARELKHVPAQKELHWLYRIYIKRRFGNWPKALIAAGLSKKAGVGGDSYEKIRNNKKTEEMLLQQIKEKSIEFGRPPHIHEMGETAEFFKNKYDTWAELLEAAGVCITCNHSGSVYKINNLTEDDKKLLEKIRVKANQLGRPPMRNEIDLEIREKLKISCNTWRNILYQIDLEPIQKLKPFSTTYLDSHKSKLIRHRDILEGSLFRLINPDEDTINQLGWIRRKSKELNRALIKQEIPKDIYKNLIEQCVSFRNILFQIGLEPLDLLKEKEIIKELRKTQKRNSIGISR
ncbi:MAG: homing endonuclease associated repeat-containing protein [Aminipila sp.]